MAAQENEKDVLSQPDTTNSNDSKELAENDLKTVSGGLPNTMGAGISAVDTAVCATGD